jgi:DNA-directed RNA polymerase specialized sigma24 family protein
MIDYDFFAYKIASGDKSAFALWMSHCEAPLRDSLARFARSVDTESVLQEALLRTWQAAPDFASDQRPNGLFRLAVRIARNLAIDILRKRREVHVAPEHDEPAEAWAPPDPMLRAKIHACHAALPDTNRRVLDARISSEGASSDEVLAVAHGMKLNTFLQNFTRARKLLAECLQRYGIHIAQELSQ